MHIQNSATKTDLLSGTAFIRPSALERSMGRLMRGPDGHADVAAPAAAPVADAPAAVEGSALGDAVADTAAAPPADTGADDSKTALGGAGDADAAAAGDAKAEGDKAEADAAKPVVPEAYELTAPEGMTLDPKSIEAATPIFKELGLTNEQANKLMPVAGQFAQMIQDQANQAIIGQVQADRKAWLDTAKADPEIGGAKWDETLSVGASALDKLGFTKGSAFRNLLDESGLGNHPEMIRAWSKVGRAIGEDGLVRGDHNTAGKKSDAELFYPEYSKSS